MKNYKKGFILPLVLGIIAVLIIGGGVYVYTNKKVEAPVVIDSNLPTRGINQADSPTWPSITVQSPNGGEVWNQDSEYIINWKYSTGNSAPAIPDRNDEIYIGFRTSKELVCWSNMKSTVGAGSVKVIPSKIICEGSIDDKKSPDFIKDLKDGGSFKAQIGVTKYSEGVGIADMSDNYFTISSVVDNRGKKVDVNARVLQDNLNYPFGSNYINIELLNTSGSVDSTVKANYDSNIVLINDLGSSHTTIGDFTSWLRLVKERYEGVKLNGEYAGSGVFRVVGSYIDNNTIKIEKIIQTIQ